MITLRCLGEAAAACGTEQRRMRAIADTNAKNPYGGDREMKIAAITTALALTGCSVLFMQDVPDKWTPRTEPRCSTTSGFIAWDLLVAAGNGVGMAINAKSLETGAIVAISALIGVHVLSAMSGTRKQGRCEAAEKARDEYLARPPTQRMEMHSAPVDAGVTVDAPIDTAPMAVDPEEPPR